MKLTLKQIANRTGGTLYGADMTVTELVTDSRSVKDGCIFAALRGERADGFDFIPQLDAHDNIAYLTDRVPQGCKNPAVVVSDVLHAIGDIAALHLESLPAKHIAVTGSVGKTTTKDYISAALGACMRVHSSRGNKNNELGMPLTALGTKPEDEAVVLEMGMRGFHEIEYLCNIARPDVAVITNIGISHIELLGSRENILKAKSEIITALPDDGTAVLNADDDMLCTLNPKVKTIRFGIENADCDIRAVDIADNSFKLSFNGVLYPVTLATEGIHNIYNSLAAVAVGAALGCDINRLIDGIQSFEGDGKRQNIFETKGVRIFDDTYNASPASMHAAMQVMSRYSGRKVLALADMLELGDYSDSAHRGLAADVRALDAAAVICIGNGMRSLYDELGGVRAYHCMSNSSALEILLKNVRRGDNILFKGSQSMNMAGLLKDFLEEYNK